jgi:hypothetical protein
MHTHCRRGTSTGKLHSSMAPPTAPPTIGASLQPLQQLYPNETRLQELLELQRRKLQLRAPPPGTYEVNEETAEFFVNLCNT